MPLALDQPAAPEVTFSAALSLQARPGDGSIRGRKVAILVADGVEGRSLVEIQATLLEQGAVARFVAPRIGLVMTTDGVTINADASLENEPGFLFDALVLPDGEAGVHELARDGHTAEVVRDQHRHCKPILVMPASRELLVNAGVPWTLPSGEADPGIIVGPDTAAFARAIARHRHHERETDPPSP